MTHRITFTHWMLRVAVILTASVAWSLAGPEPTKNVTPPDGKTKYAVFHAPIADLAGRTILLDPPPTPSGGSGVQGVPVGEPKSISVKDLGDFAGDEPTPPLLRSDQAATQDQPPLPLSPTPRLGFNGVINSPATNTPPDTHVAVGSGLGSAGRVVMVTNGHVQIWDKNGTVVASPLLLDTMFAVNVFDPKVLYDQHSGRFFIVALEGNNNAFSQIHLAVSSNSTPNNLTSNWTFMTGSAITTVGAFTTWADYPGIGADSDSLFVTANLFDSGSPSTMRGVKIRVFNKASLLAGVYSFIDINYDSAVTSISTTQPAHVYGTTDNGGFYLISRLGSSTYRLINITGDPVAPVATTSTRTWSAGAQITVGAPQSGTAIVLDTLSARVINAVYRGGHLWCCLTSDADADGKAEAVWQDIATNGSTSLASVSQSGYIDGTDSSAWTFMPAINVNASNEAAIGYTQSSPTDFPGVYYVMRIASDPPGTFQPPTVAKAGPGYYDGFSTAVPERWGDYSAAVVDPDDNCFWIANEFAFSSAPAASTWGTYIASFCSATPPSMAVLAPNGGESWARGSSHSISWLSVAGGPTVDIDLLQGGVPVLNIATGAPNSSPFSWAIPGGQSPGTNYRVRISDGVSTDTSDADFSIVDLIDYFTELFTGGGHSFDLANKSILFTPAGPSSYTPCLSTIASLPTDPAGGTNLGLSDDSYASITLGGGSTVSIYGTSSATFYAGSNGYVTLGSGDFEFDESFAHHFNLKRISLLFTDLDPGAGGSVSFKQLGDRAVVTWLNVPEVGTGNSNTFQVEMYYDGRIRVAWLAVASTSNLVGLSNGGGVPPSFVESNLSAYSGCTRSIVQWRSVRTHTGDGPLGIVLNATASGNGLSGPTVETRGPTAINPGVQRIEVDFDAPITLTGSPTTGITVIGRTTTYPGGVATLGGPVSYAPSTVVLADTDTLAINFNPGVLPDESCYSITIDTGTITLPITGDNNCNIRSLLGDTTMSGKVNLSDALFTNTKVGQSAAANVQHDVTLGGGTILNDRPLLVKSRVTKPAREALCP